MTVENNENAVKNIIVPPIMYELAEQLKSLKEKKKEIENIQEDINAQIKDVELHLASMMAESEMQNFTRAGTMYSLVNKTRASAAAGNKDKLYAALRKEGYGDLVSETVNANSLSTFVKEQISENKDTLPEWLNGLVNVYEQPAVSIRRAVKKKG